MTLRIPSLLIIILVPELLGQEPETPVFRAGVTQVRMDIQVIDGERVVSGLRREDFALYDENSLQPIRYFAREEEPLALLLLLDVSGSMKRYLEQMAQTAQKALGQLGPKDRVGVMAFSKGTELLFALSPNLKEAAREIEVGPSGVKMPAGTAINAAVVEAAHVLGQDLDSVREPVRRSVLILTDNGSLNYQVTDEMAIRALGDSGAVLNAIVVGKPRTALRGVRSANSDFTPADVFRLVEATGGEALRADKADEAFPELIRRLRNRYTLAYAAPETAASGGFRRVRIELTGAAKKKYPRARVLARTGYYAP
jgi:VWFA-related protein